MDTLAGYMTSQFSFAQYLDFFLRIIIACICGAAIGVERSMRFKEAGIRTHMIVCCAASLMMIVSKYGFADLGNSEIGFFNGTRGADPARIAAQVVSGVSFLGAGVIFHNGSSIHGLTTAAGVWVTAGIGLSLGSGMYVIGIFSTAIVALIQYLMHRHSFSADVFNIGHVHCKVTQDFNFNFNKSIKDFIENNDIQIMDSKITFNDDNTTAYDFTLRMNQNITIDNLSDFLTSHKGIKEISCEITR